MPTPVFLSSFRLFRPGGALTAACLLLLTFSAGAQVRSPFVEERLGDPIRWTEWTAETPAALRSADRPVLVVVSHELNSLTRAMATESFGNKDIAARINGHFSAVVIDKNQHPGVADFFAMMVSHAKQVHGWPVTVFLTPDLEYIDGGGYFTAADNWGNPGLSTVAKTVSEQWKRQREVVAAKARNAMEELADYYGESSEPSTPFSMEFVSLAVANLADQFDFEFGGFSAAPKSVGFELLQVLDVEIDSQGPEAARATKMRDRMWHALLREGVRDYVHGGFFSAATDDQWTVPDFRKSLPVQAQAIAHLSMYPEQNHVVVETANCLLQEFLGEGGFFSEVIARGSVDASGGEVNPSSLYTWSMREIESVLSPDELTKFMETFDVSSGGNISAEQDPGEVFKGRNVLRVREDAGGPGAESDVLGTALQKLRQASETRSRVEREQVSSVTTNALAISALARVGGDPGSKYIRQAEATARAVWDACWDAGKSRLAPAVLEGRALPGEASARGYAAFAAALIELAEVTGEAEYEKRGNTLLTILAERFGSEAGPVFETPKDDDSVPQRFFAFREDGVSSANALLLRIARQHGEKSGLPGVGTASIRAHLPEDVSFSPEMFPGLLTAAVPARHGE